MLLFYVSIIYRLELIISTSLNVLASFFSKTNDFQRKVLKISTECIGLILA